ncbi:acyltransferase family protein [Streptomyces lasiicapitis]|uniref:Acyltransferase n=1 Tax=Streptomyces lasiicapitis TaxID=1923961 RepID=A0ABQ2LNM6_9ACTN|nr:acyltransferase [Streptomyces lasiicapitis]GGO40937.1 acyltransferase [Streptomyces lasiicapitis]
MPRDGSAAGRSHITALDGLRGFAVGAVLLFHAGHLRGGFLGVDLFFVLSGFLITGLLLGEAKAKPKAKAKARGAKRRARGRIDLAAFWGRRARRLLPALLCVVVVTVPATWAWGSPEQLRFALDDMPWVGAQAVNWHYITEQIGYWNASDTRVFAHLWSIGVEWQFYLAWPLVVAVAARARCGERIVAALAGAGALVSLALTVSLGAAVDTTRAYEGTDTRAAALLLGALVATAPVRNLVRRVPPRVADPVCLALACGLAVAWAVTEGEKAPLLFQGGLFLHSLTAAVLIVLMAQVPGTRAARIAGSRLPRGLGRLSYSLYLWHWPVYLLLLPRLTALGDWGGTAVAIGVSLAAAAVTTRCVEDPVRFRAGWARGGRGPIVVGAVALAGAVLWVAVPEPVTGVGTVDVDQLR